MAKRRPKVDLVQTVEPRTGDLAKLFSVEGDVEQATGSDLLAVRLDAIRSDPNQPRRTFPESSLKELSESIKQEGVIQPIELTEISPNHYQLVHGERRWKAASMAGLETIPAVVRRTQYDDATRLVRQLVENIQREDLNDVDRAAGLIRLRDLLQEDLDTAAPDGDRAGGPAPWSKTVTWAKVGNRLGFSRQRIHQLIRLLDLPEEIKEDVREGRLSERETRVYQGLRARQQRDLHQARYKRDLSAKEIRQVARILKAAPTKTVYQAIREVRQSEQSFDGSFDPSAGEVFDSGGAQPGSEERQASRRTEGKTEPKQPSNLQRLELVREHLNQIQPVGLGRNEYQEIFRLLTLIQQDVTALLASLLGESMADEST